MELKFKYKIFAHYVTGDLVNTYFNFKSNREYYVAGEVYERKEGNIMIDTIYLLDDLEEV